MQSALVSDRADAFGLVKIGVFRRQITREILHVTPRYTPSMAEESWDLTDFSKAAAPEFVHSDTTLKMAKKCMFLEKKWSTSG